MRYQRDLARCRLYHVFIFVGALAYVDDALSQSISIQLQICEKYDSEFSIQFNASKSWCCNVLNHWF